MPFDQLQFPDHFTPIPFIDLMCTELPQTLPFKPGLLGTAPLRNSHYVLEEDQFSDVPISLEMTPNWLLHLCDEAKDNVSHTADSAQLGGCKHQVVNPSQT